MTGWRPIETAPQNGTRIRLHRLGRYGWAEPEIGRWEVKPDGFKGWWNDQDEYLGVPDSWLPLETQHIH